MTIGIRPGPEKTTLLRLGYVFIGMVCGFGMGQQANVLRMTPVAGDIVVICHYAHTQYQY